MLATGLAADIAAVIPIVCDLMVESVPAPTERTDGTKRVPAHEALRREPGVIALGAARAFRAQFDERLKALTQGRARRVGMLTDKLSLMDESRLGVELAIDQCIARIKEQSAGDVFQLTARMADMLGKPVLDDAANPIAPRVLVRALADALRELDLSSAELLAIFKAFGPPMLHIASDLYRHANELLVECGVLEDFKAAYGRPVHSAGKPAVANVESIIKDEKTLAGILERLLHGTRSGARPAFI
jgi:hypothetical protein